MKVKSERYNSPAKDGPSFLYLAISLLILICNERELFICRVVAQEVIKSRTQMYAIIKQKNSPELSRFILISCIKVVCIHNSNVKLDSSSTN